MELQSSQVIGGQIYNNQGTLLNKYYRVKNNILSTEEYSIYNVIDLETNQFLRVKILNKQNYTNKQRILWEINNHRICNGHQNFIQINQVYQDTKYIYVLMEPWGTMLCDILKIRNFLTQRQVQFIYCQLVNILEHLRKNNIVHRSISMESIFIDTNTLSIKLGQFNQSLNIEKLTTTANQSKRNCTQYSSPQQLLGALQQKDMYSIDIWSIGVIIYILLVGQFPFSEDGNPSLLKIKNCCFKFPEQQQKDFVSKIWKELLKRIFVPYSSRIFLRQLIEHPLKQDIQQKQSQSYYPLFCPSLLNNCIITKRQPQNIWNNTKKNSQKKIQKIPPIITEPDFITKFHYDAGIKSLGYIINNSLGILFQDKTIIIGHNQFDFDYYGSNSITKKKQKIYQHFLNYFGTRVITNDLSIWVKNVWNDGNIWIFLFNTGTWQVNMGNGYILIDKYGLGWWKGAGVQIHLVKIARNIIKPLKQQIENFQQLLQEIYD